MNALYTAVRAERFPDHAAVAREAKRPVPAPALVLRGGKPVSVDDLARDAAARVEHERAWAECRANRKRFLEGRCA